MIWVSGWWGGQHSGVFVNRAGHLTQLASLCPTFFGGYGYNGLALPGGLREQACRVRFFVHVE